MFSTSLLPPGILAGLPSPWNVGHCKPWAWPARRRGFINKCAQLLPSFMSWLRVCAPCLHESLRRSRGLSDKFIISPGSVMCYSVCGFLIWVVHFQKAGP